MEKQINKPQLRFSEFEGEWEKKKLGEVAEFYSGGTPLTTKRQYFGGKIPFIRSGEITSDKTEQFITDEGLKNSSAKIVDVGDILYALYGATSGEVGISRIKGAINQAVLCIRSNQNHYYIYSVLKFQKENITNTFLQGGQGNLSADIVKKIDISFPTLPEQTKIATFLTAVDEKIQALKKKKSLLEDYKKGVMQKLFSQELRFKDENGNDFPDWEMKKLGEVCEIIGGGTPETSKDEYWNGNIQWFTPTEIKTDYVSKSSRTITALGLQKSSAKKLPIGTILLTTRATIGEASIALEECTTNQGFQSLVTKKGNNNVYIFNWIKENKHELSSRANGSTFPEISKSEIEKIKIPTSCLKEQTLIANFLSSIDEKINQTQTEIAKTEQWKKGLLQQMFC